MTYVPTGAAFPTTKNITGAEKCLRKILEQNDIEELIVLPLSVGQNYPDWKYAQDLCVKLSKHGDSRVRANAILGLAYIARTKGKLEKHIVKPIILKELRENKEFEWRIIDAINHINLFLKWSDQYG